MCPVVRSVDWWTWFPCGRREWLWRCIIYWHANAHIQSQLCLPFPLSAVPSSDWTRALCIFHLCAANPGVVCPHVDNQNTAVNDPEVGSPFCDTCSPTACGLQSPPKEEAKRSPVVVLPGLSVFGFLCPFPSPSPSPPSTRGHQHVPYPCTTPH